MNEAEAQRELRRPLVFGDDAQIRAVRFLDEVAVTVDEILGAPECKNCNGTGQIYAGCEDKECHCPEHLTDCLFCAGLGRLVSELTIWKDDVMEAARDRIIRSRRR